VLSKGNNLLLREHLSLQPVWQQLQVPAQGAIRSAISCGKNFPVIDQDFPDIDQENQKNRKKYLSIFPASHFCQTLVIVFKFLLQKIQIKKINFLHCVSDFCEK